MSATLMRKVVPAWDTTFSSIMMLPRSLAPNFRATWPTAGPWVTQGQEIGQVALKFGANDLGSIMIEENVVSQAGTTFRMTVADMHRLIKDIGYEPHQRDNWYRLLN